MQKIILEIESSELAEQILWMLEHFKDDGVTISFEKKSIIIDVKKCKETFLDIANRDFSKIKTIRSLESHFEEIGINEI